MRCSIHFRHTCSEILTRSVALDVSPLVINRHARLRSILLHLGCRLLSAFQHAKDVLACKSSKIALRPAAPANEFFELRMLVVSFSRCH